MLYPPPPSLPLSLYPWKAGMHNGARTRMGTILTSKYIILKTSPVPSLFSQCLWGKSFLLTCIERYQFELSTLYYYNYFRSSNWYCSMHAYKVLWCPIREFKWSMILACMRGCFCRRSSRREHRSHDDRDRSRSGHRSSKHHRDRSRERRHWDSENIISTVCSSA